MMTWERATRKESIFGYPTRQKPTEHDWAQGPNPHGKPLQVGEVKASQSTVEPGGRTQMSLFTTLGVWLVKGARMVHKFGLG